MAWRSVLWIWPEEACCAVDMAWRDVLCCGYGLKRHAVDMAWRGVLWIWPEEVRCGYGLKMCAVDMAWRDVLWIWPEEACCGYGLKRCAVDHYYPPCDILGSCVLPSLIYESSPQDMQISVEGGGRGEYLHYSCAAARRGSQRDVVHLGLPRAPSYKSPNDAGGGGVRGLSQWVQLCIWSPNKLWRSNSIFNLWLQRLRL